MTARAISYAETELGVHSVHGQALARRDDLDKCLTDLASERDRRRDLEFSITDAEMEVIGAERGKHPDMAVTRWEKHIKEAYRKDDTLRELNEQLTNAQSNIEGLEFDRSIIETDIRISIARMHELGGYFQYLAECKSAASAVAAPTPSTLENGQASDS